MERLPNEGTQVENAYTYTNLFPSLRIRQGYSLEADVSLKFNTFLKKFTFDTNQKLSGPSAGDFDYANRFPEDGKIIFETIATTPIVSKTYDPSCMVSYVVGWIRRMKAEGWDQKDLTRLDKVFAAEVCYVDKDVITEVIDFGLNYANEFGHAADIADISHNMILQETNIANLYI